MYYEINTDILPKVRLTDIASLEAPNVHRRRQPDEYILYVMISGTLYLRENETEYCLKEGDVLLLDTDFVHEGIKASNCEYFYIHFRHPGMRRVEPGLDFAKRCMEQRSCSLQEEGCTCECYEREHKLLFPKYASLKNGRGCIRIMKMIREARGYNLNQIEAYKTVCACKILEVMVEIAREAASVMIVEQRPKIPESYGKVHDLLDYLNANYQKQISASQIEELFSCNFDYINRMFKKNIGKTIFVYLNEVRIQRAKELIATTSMKLSAVGYRVGYRDEGYFGKVFRKHTGMSPSQYGIAVGEQKQ